MKSLIERASLIVLLVSAVSAFAAGESDTATLEIERQKHASAFVDGCAVGIADSKLPGMLAAARAAGQAELTLSQLRASFLAGTHYQTDIRPGLEAGCRCVLADRLDALAHAASLAQLQTLTAQLHNDLNGSETQSASPEVMRLRQRASGCFQGEAAAFLRSGR